VRTNRYSVPARPIGRQVRVLLLHPSRLLVFDGREQVARHERLPGKGEARLDLDHYLEALIRKPGALPGATALDQARAAGKFSPVHDAWWAAACKALWLLADVGVTEVRGLKGVLPEAALPRRTRRPAAGCQGALWDLARRASTTHMGAGTGKTCKTFPTRR
jgi:hypothetical protein